jgi:crotonobetainyl-CoA:carnitine CoA-transferase CaiB-like acyl-CoA transferase
VPDQALSGLTALDLSQNISGPYCAKLLCDCGAKVIKVEKPPSGDPSRQSGPFPNDKPDPETSGLFLSLNTGKKSITLNLESEAGQQILKKLVEKADVVVETSKPGAMANLGLDFDALSTINPSLIMASITCFGQWGPYCDWAATDIVAQAKIGRAHV